MYEPKKYSVWIWLRLLILATVLAAICVQFRPTQLKPQEIRPSSTKADVYWLCGPPSSMFDEDLWVYRTDTGSVVVIFDSADKVVAVEQVRTPRPISP